MQNTKLINDIEQQLKEVSMPERAHNERRAIFQHFRKVLANEQAAKRTPKSQSKTDKE